MAQLERPQRHVESSKSPTIHTMEQLLRAEGSKSNKQSPTYSSCSSTSSSSSSSPFFQRLRHHDLDDDHSPNQKKSVLTKVKEKAKKLRHTLSKKKHDDGNSSPSWIASLEADGVEEDAEYLGAPMYQSEKAPVGYKENTRQHSRGSPVISENKHVNVMSSSDKTRMEYDNKEKSLTRSLSKRTTQPTTPPATPTATTASAAANALSGSNRTKTRTVAEKLTPSYAEGSDAAHSVTSKIQGLNVSKPSEHHHHHTSSSNLAPAKAHNSPPSLAASRSASAKVTSQASSSISVVPRTSSAPVAAVPPSSPSSAPSSGKSTSPTSQLWDKGVSVKDYLMNKLEPGEDEKALSQVISEAMSPRRTPGDAGVMEKVREAVTSLLRNEEPTKYAETNTTPTTMTSSQSQIPASNNATRASSQIPASNTTNAARASSQIPSTTAYAARNSPQIPVSTNPHEVVQEENHGRILQAN